MERQGDNRRHVDESELEAGAFTYVHLRISNVDATLNDGDEANVDTAGEA